MADNLYLYRNREQTYIKHQFLTKYLETLAYMILQGYWQTFNFVDAFAGPWKVSDDAKYSDASFDQAIKTLVKVRAILRHKGKTEIKIRFCFCEKNPEAVKRLREYVDKKKMAGVYIFEGAFEDNLDAIAAKIPDGFTFTFIDPTGWNIRNEDVFNFLRERTGEFMLNFMSDHINRHAGFDQVADSFKLFLADPQWEEEFSKLPANWGNEFKMLHLMKAAMRKYRVAKYVPDFSIMVPREERLKMRLLLGTHKPVGLEVFRDVQERVEKQEMEMRHKLKEGDSPHLFSAEDYAAIQKKEKGVGCITYRRRAEARIINTLKRQSFALADHLIVEAMEFVPIRRTQIKDLLVEMYKHGVIHFELPKGKRKPQEDTRISLA
jgi:three-Cys-motif partner protein